MRIQKLLTILLCLIIATTSYAQQEVKITEIAIIPNDSAIVESPDVLPEIGRAHV